MKPWYFFRPVMALRTLKARYSRDPGEQAEVRTAFGCRLKVDANDAIGRALLRNEIFDIGVSEVIARLAAADAVTLVDVGANIGYMTMVMAHFSKEGARVWAFEPVPALHAALVGNISLNGLGARVSALRRAVSDSRGARDLFLPAGYAANCGLASLEPVSGERVTVDATTLDHEFGDARIDLLKIDVEGHEVAVLRGGAHLLARKRIRAMIFEAHGPQFPDLLDLLTGYGYVVRRIEYGLMGLRLRAPEEPIDIKFEAPNYLAVPDAGVLESLSGRGWRCLRA